MPWYTDPIIVSGLATIAAIALPAAADDIMNGSLDADERATPLDIGAAWAGEFVADAMNEGLTED